MSVKCKKIIEELNKLAPEYLAEEWDNVGLMIGDIDQEVNRVLIALDAIPEVIEEAIKEKVDLIITHHPFIFKPLKSITKNDAIGQSIYSLIKNNIGVYSAHTNLDIAFGGTNDTLANLLELENISVLKEIDNYGMGRIGNLKNACTLEEYAKFVKEKLKISNIRVVGNPTKVINIVALTTGSGISYIQEAVNKKADLFITGDVKFHDAQKAKELGIALIDAGHYGTENIIIPVIKKYLENINKEDKKLEIIVSKINGDPFILY
ncbi:Nif3-like dinuclear metal center hexameric protein [Defluviitalea phaphyphila]|uniref:Nif3-like dinuclear metal center hexameric protein n=1 Tax=Defluviitalea phaphyphila TaxID=1473580 RepID=UPI0007306900|nr:Nif3-like dinuclear metal center hexameric protein [Defluviitalea phaphyphila]